MGQSSSKPIHSPTIDKGLLNQQVVVSTNQTPIPVDLLRGNYLVIGIYLIVFLEIIHIILFIFTKYKRGLKKKYLEKRQILE